MRPKSKALDSVIVVYEISQFSLIMLCLVLRKVFYL